MLRRSTPNRSLSFYEVNLNTVSGTAGKEVLDRYTPSLAAGLGVANLMLGAQVKLHVRTQQLFTLAQFAFQRKDNTEVRLWGSVLDMGVTNRRRPQFLALELANRAIAGDMMKVRQSGQDPLRVRPSSDGLGVAADLHEIAAYAYRVEGDIRLLVFNLNTTQNENIELTGMYQPRAALRGTRLAGPSPGSTNEEESQVTLKDTGEVNPKAITLPPASMTLFSWRPHSPRQ